MREHSLRSVLLVKAVEEADKTGALITPAERIAASKESRRDVATTGDDGRRALSGPAQRMLVQRAGILNRRLVERYPFIASVRDAAAGPRQAGLLVIACALLLGFGLSALDGTQRINLLAPGLIGLVLWNVAVYALLLVRAIRRRDTTKARPLSRLLAHNATAALQKLITRSASFNAPLAAALKSFAREWIDAARPLLLARAARVVHLGAAAIGAGLIAGLYARGVALEYVAGWESTFLDASQVRVLFHGLYGPASFATAIPLPDAAQVEALRFTPNTGGERATKWIHLLAATVALSVIVPRLGLALLATTAIARWSWAMPLPSSLPSYFRNVFGAVDSSIGRGIVMVAPYAHTVPAPSIARLRELLPKAFGSDLAVDLREPIAYGGEDDFIRHLPDRGGAIADIIVLLFNLASTPEEENHGTLLAAARDWMTSHRRQAQLLILLDASSYAERMGSDSKRIDERRRAWEAFVVERGLAVAVVDLATPATANAADADAATIIGLKKALWQPE